MPKPQPASPPIHRRRFLQGAAAAAGLPAMAAFPSTLRADLQAGHRLYPVIQPGDVVLFQGDSITDAGRSRKAADKPNHPPAMGKGYAWLAASQLLVDRPKEKILCFNRGISGNKVFQLADRWQEDCLDLKPDVLSILIGVNDIWHRLNGQYDGTVQTYENDYRALLQRTRKALPDLQLVLCEPFVLRCGAVNDQWFPLFDQYRAAARRVARDFGAIWVPFQTVFDAASKVAPPDHWAGDGVHPSKEGASLMAHNWLKAVQLRTTA